MSLWGCIGVTCLHTRGVSVSVCVYVGNMCVCSQLKIQ